MGNGGRVVLVTGVSRDLGRRFAVSMSAHPEVARVIGVDVVPPRGDLGDVSFVRADIRNPIIAKVIAKEDVDTVVHMSVIATPGSAGGRHTMKELNVIGTMQLLAACQKAPGLRHLVVKSTTTVYGASSRDPAMFTEDMQPRRAHQSGYSKDAAEVEGYVRGFGRRPELFGGFGAGSADPATGAVVSVGQFRSFGDRGIVTTINRSAEETIEATVFVYCR